MSSEIPATSLDLPRPGWYRVVWTCDVDKVEAASPEEAARIALEMQCSADQMLANPFTVVDGDTGGTRELDLLNLDALPSDSARPVNRRA